MMNALFFTAYDRPDYLRQTLDSWEKVRGLQDWHCVARIEPGPRAEEACWVFTQFFETMMIPSFEVITNPEVYGVLHHPYVGFRDLFLDHDFVMRAEDDLIVSDDILEYFTWAERTYRNVEGVATIHGFTTLSGDPAGVYRSMRFNPWVWGTWRPVWDTVIEHTWDHAYTTFNESPGFESGWDWNLDTRIFPRYGYQGLYPQCSRVQNIGLWGVHGTPDNIQRAVSFQETYGTLKYIDARSNA